MHLGRARADVEGIAAAPCPGCGADSDVRLRLSGQPVVLNYRLPSPHAALAVPTGDIVLAQCRTCGLAFNAAFDPALLPYDASYENTQTHSPTFRCYLRNLATDLVERHGLRGKRVLEIGCGKGAFLALVVSLGDNHGYGYDTTWEDNGSPHDARLTFFTHRVTPHEIRDHYDAIVCRHVIEHVPDVRGFLADLAAIAAAAGDPVVMLETPALEWICEHGCFWDIFYEHCNYFSLPTLAWLCAQAGFTIDAQERRFDEQYQVVWLRRGATSRPAPPGQAAADLGRAANTMERRRADLETALVAAGATKGWAVWGAGAKGVTLAHRLTMPPRCLIDVNPAKQGGYIPGLAIPIVAPGSALVSEIAAILIANPNYASEIRSALEDLGITASVLLL